VKANVNATKQERSGARQLSALTAAAETWSKEVLKGLRQSEAARTSSLLACAYRTLWQLRQFHHFGCIRLEKLWIDYLDPVGAISARPRSGPTATPLRYESKNPHTYGSARPNNERSYGTSCRYPNNGVARQHNHSRHLCLDRKFELFGL
jgi:hypothetical protein